MFWKINLYTLVQIYGSKFKIQIGGNYHEQIIHQKNQHLLAANGPVVINSKIQNMKEFALTIRGIPTPVPCPSDYRLALPGRGGEVQTGNQQLQIRGINSCWSGEVGDRSTVPGLGEMRINSFWSRGRGQVRSNINTPPPVNRPTLPPLPSLIQSTWSVIK